MLIAGKVAIVTGAAQGIGQACAVRLAKEGAKVVVCDVNDKAGERVAKAIEGKGGAAAYVHCDVSKVGDVAGALKAALGAFKRVDVLVNNAGVVDDAPFLDLPLEELDRVLSINLRGAFLMAQAVARQMVGQGKGKGGKPAGAIVNMSSVNERFGLPDHVAYSMSKGGISQLTKAMAVALAPARHPRQCGGARHHRYAAAEGCGEGQGVPRQGAVAHAARPLRPAVRDRRHRRLARQRRGELCHGDHGVRGRRAAAAELRDAGGGLEFFRSGGA